MKLFQSSQVFPLPFVFDTPFSESDPHDLVKHAEE